jgi:hypothetical protein
LRDTREVKAAGLQSDMSPEIIEILDDNSDIFGDRAPNATHDTGGPGWAGPIAAAALVALIGYGVATSSSSTSVPKAAPAPSTVPRVHTTVPAPTTTEPASPPVPYYAADPPLGLALDSADLQPADNGFRDGPVAYELWATEGATASSGTWFSVQVDRGGPIYAVDAFRVQTDQQSIAVSHTSTGQSTAQFQTDRGTGITVTSFGWSDDDLVRLAAAMTFDGEIGITDASLTAGYQMITSVAPLLALRGIPLEQVSYQSDTDVTGGVRIDVAPRLRSDEGGATLDRQIALRFFLDQTAGFDVDGHSGLAGAVVGLDGVSIATWIAGTHIVTVWGAMSVPDLISIAHTVHQVSPEDWNGMKFQAAKHNADHNVGNFDPSPSTPVYAGTDGTGSPWVITVSVVTIAEQQQLIWGWVGTNQIGSIADDTPKINTVVNGRRTYVLADLPKAVAAQANLQITRNGLDPVVVPFNDANPDSDRTFAAYAFSEPTTYTAQIISVDGAVLANWPRA